jgi:signal transduction histidine kinase/CheY-like chemotaxis protein
MFSWEVRRGASFLTGRASCAHTPVGVCAQRKVAQLGDSPQRSLVLTRALGAFLFLWTAAGASELGRPLLRYFPPSAYERSDQLWSIAQDPRGVMYFGCFSVTVTYDGTSWGEIEMPFARVVRGLAAAPDGTIYAGGNNQLGYFQDAPGGKKQFISLLEHLPENERDFREISAIAASGDAVAFAAARKIFVWRNDRFTIIDHGGATAFAAGTTLYLQKTGGPLQRLDGDRLALVSADVVFKESAIAFISDGPDGALLVGTVDRGLFWLRAGQLVPRLTAIDDALTSKKIGQGILLADGSCAIALQSGGVLFIDADGRLLTALDEKAGLKSAVNAFLPDREGGLWLGLWEGALRVEWPAHVSAFDASNGVGNGVVLNTVRYDGTLYLAGHMAVRRLVASAGTTPAHFEPVPGLTGSVRHLLPQPDGLYAGDATGIYRLGKTGFERVLTFPVKSAAGPRFGTSSVDPERVWVLQPEGLRSIHRTPGGWRDEGLVPGVDRAVSFAAEEPDGTLWLSKVFDGFMRVRFTGQTASDRGTAVVTDFPGGHGLPAKLAGNNTVSLWRGRALFHIDYGLYRFDSAAERFVPTDEAGPRLNQPPLSMIGINPARPDGLWVVGTVAPPGKGADRGNRTFLVNADRSWQALPHFMDNARGIVGRATLLEEVSPDGRTVFWNGGTSGLFRAELPAAFVTRPTFPVFIRAEAIEEGHPWPGTAVLRDVTDPRLPPEIKPDPVTQPQDFAANAILAAAANSVRFHFTAPRQKLGAEPHYQSKLEGYDREWTPWSGERVRAFTNLPPGGYRFLVRARDTDGYESEVAACPFTLAPPAWRTWWAFGGYALSGGLFVFGLVRWRGRALRRRNVELEQTVQVRTATLVQREQQLSEARDAAESANRAKSVFLASMSHELRTPLNAILGYTQLLRGSPEVPAESRRQLEVIHQSGEHLAGMINEVLDLAKVESGRIELSAQPFSLSRLLALLTEIFSLRAAQKGLAFALHTAPGVPDSVTGDEARLRQVLLNLLGNALKFTAAGRIELQVGPADGRIRFVVTDTGIGIPAAEQSRIFERFYQAAGPAFAAQGAGLGLAISQRLVRLMGGVIQVESTPGHGSSFRFELVLPAAAAAPAPLPERLPTGYRGPRLRVLVVDDEPVNRDLLRTLLHPLGFLIEETDDGATALERVATQPPALILMDIRLKSLNGLEATRRIRALPMGDQIRIVAVTASVFPDDRTQAIAAGCDEFAEKPIQTARLIEMIGQLLQLDWIRPTESLGSRAPILPEQLPGSWARPAATVLDDLEALAEIGDLVAFRARLAAARSEETAAHDLLDALHSLAAQARLADLRRWLEAARRRPSSS